MRKRDDWCNFAMATWPAICKINHEMKSILQWIIKSIYIKSLKSCFLIISSVQTHATKTFNKITEMSKQWKRICCFWINIVFITDLVISLMSANLINVPVVIMTSLCEQPMWMFSSQMLWELNKIQEINNLKFNYVFYS